jgi:hypothetical protein
VDTVLLPAIEPNQTLESCNNKPAVLFCDKGSAQCTESILQKLARREVIVVTCPPHTSHVFQVLDGLLFGVLKRAKNNQRRDDELPAQGDHVLRLFRIYEQATTSMTVRVLWVKTGFQYEEMDNARYPTVNKAVIRSPTVFVKFGDSALCWIA